MKYLLCLLLTSLIISNLQVHAQAISDHREFATPQQQTRYEQMIRVIRCPTCQNQDIAESNAPLAAQLRTLIASQINAGKSDSEIQTYLISRYGDFISYAPPFHARTWLLWLSPAILMALALLIWLSTRRKTRAQLQLTPEQDAQLDQWLKTYRNPQP